MTDCEGLQNLVDEWRTAARTAPEPAAAVYTRCVDDLRAVTDTPEAHPAGYVTVGQVLGHADRIVILMDPRTGRYGLERWPRIPGQQRFVSLPPDGRRVPTPTRVALPQLSWFGVMDAVRELTSERNHDA